MTKYDKQWLEETCKECYSYAEVLRRKGIKPSGGNYEILKKKIKEYEIDISHFTHKEWNKGKTHERDKRIATSKLTDEDVFFKGNTKSRIVIRKYILRNNSIEYKCEMCGNIGEWMGKTISLELDHIDGDPMNNEKSNLRFLCPNCHATTSTYRGKNKKINNKIDIRQNKIDRYDKDDSKKDICPICNINLKSKKAEMCIECYKTKQSIIPVTREQLKYEIRNYSFLQVGKIHNNSDNTIRKWCKKLNLPYRREDISKISNEEWDKI